jgi:hypothetical protein
MTRERAKELLPVITAWREGKRVQVMSIPRTEWVDLKDPNWNEPPSCYRIAPEPFETWAVIVSDGAALSREDAQRQAAAWRGKDTARAVLLREVVE